jgi:fatty-acyl-CoA synthase
VFRVREDDKSAPFRDERGFCVQAHNGEVGLIMNVVNNAVVERRFDGYSDSSASNSKLLKDVLVKGDCYFNSGDLLSRDGEGFYYW